MFYPLYVTYEVLEGKPIIKVHGRDESGKKKVIEDENFEPYFYIIPEQEKLEEVKEIILNYEQSQKGETIRVKRVEVTERIELNRNLKVLKVICNLPRDVSAIKEGIRALPGVLHKREYDLPFARRYALDKQINFLSPYEAKDGVFRELEGKPYEPKVAAFDIEVLSCNFKHKENPIICIGLYSDTEETVFTYKESKFGKAVTLKDEREMLNGFFEAAEDYDVLVSYNGDNFDLPFLQGRCKALGINCPITLSARGAKFRGLLHVDLYTVVSKHLRMEIKTKSRKLNDVAQFFLDEGKTGLDIAGSGEDIWNSDDLKRIAELFEYNLQDCKITFLLGEKFLPLEYRFSNIVALDLFNVTRIGFSQLVEGYLMKQATGQDILIPNKPGGNDIEERRLQTYVGAYVHKPVPGLYQNVSVMDFKSLYPSILVSHNISPDTLDEEKGEQAIRIKGPKGEVVHRFSKSPEGFIVRILREIIERRAKMKKESGKGVDEKALKNLANATYGYLGFFGARWYSKECAESITALGRGYIQTTILEAEKAGLKVIYGDTDSLMATGEKGLVKSFLKNVNDNLPGIMELDYQGFYPRGIFVGEEGRGTKKRYALIDESGNIEIKGFEFVRGDWSRIAKETQMRVIEHVLDGKAEKAVEFVKETCRRIRKGEIEKEWLIISRQMTKSPERYGIISPHVKVARDLKRKGVSIYPGFVVKYIITREGKLVSDRAKWWEDAMNYDSEYYINNQVIPPAYRILSVLGYSKQELIGCQTNLGSF
ncbi:MAG: ribonuclease H-like domain-containing protein [Candidatus Aenigmarchaeota archaeon]|nr:ribonuclease H-like domain-containing protein [Candidatus Aenigmarchaeota archaeon]